MSTDVITDSAADDRPRSPWSTPRSLVEDELLVEEVSIDGMCGVY